MSKQFEEIVLYEIRQNRKEIQKLKLQVFSNKMRLGIFMSGVSLLTSIIVIVIAEKVKSLFLT